MSQMGIAADGSNKAFPSQDVDNFLDRKRAKIPVDIMEELSRYNTRHFVLAGACPAVLPLTPSKLTQCMRALAVDPSGGGGSAFAVSSMVQIPTGQIIVRCLCPRPPPATDNCPTAPPPKALPTRLPAPQTSRESDTNCARSAEG